MNSSGGPAAMPVSTTGSFAGSPHETVPLRPAAVLVLVRDGHGGLEVFMAQRNAAAVFLPGVHVFPGGAVDDCDHRLATFCSGLDDATASPRLGLTSGGLAYWVSAIRECFEESGVLLATDSKGRLLDLDHPGNGLPIQEARAGLNAGRVRFIDICRQFDLRLALDQMAYYSHWITPVGSNRRYDTRFFIAIAPPAQAAVHDGAENVDSAWIRPVDALRQYREGRFPLVHATRTTLERLAGFRDAAGVMAHARAQRQIAPIMPRIAVGRDGRQVLNPTDAAYAEVARLDPEGRGDVSCRIVPGVPVRIGQNVYRVTAPNPGFMTGPGTNTYLLGDADGVTVIDPGPDDPGHIEVIRTVAPGPIRAILCTHTHLDHSPAAQVLKALTGARVIGWRARTPGQDDTFQPDHEPADGERIPTRAGGLRVVHTPGHAANHLCYLLESERLLFTGDHIMQGSTVVISPPDGNMRDYLASLRMLQAEDIDYLAPAHGFLMDEPRKVVAELIDHRMRREELVLKALAAGPMTVKALAARVYTQLPEPLRPVAERSLLAHLEKLSDENRADCTDGVWRLAR